MTNRPYFYNYIRRAEAFARENSAISHYGHYTPVGCRVKRHSMCNDGVKSFFEASSF